MQKGYCKEVKEEDSLPEDAVLWYLPHHPVLHAMKPDKVRIVFDCASKCGGVSLNDVVHQGPDLTNKLIGVLLRFRDTENVVGANSYLFTANSTPVNKLPTVTVLINGVNTKAIIDTGATLRTVYQNQLALEPAKQHIYAFGSASPISLIGQFNLPVCYKAERCRAKFFVTQHTGPTLLCRRSASELQLISIAYNISDQFNSSILYEFADRLTGLGKLKGATCQLHVDESVTPITQSDTSAYHSMVKVNVLD